MAKFVPKQIKRSVEHGFIMYEYELYLDYGDDESFCGVLKFSDFNLDVFTNFIKDNKEEWLDIFEDIFDVERCEAVAITSTIKDDRDYIYIQKIDLGFSHGMGIGKLVIDLLKKAFPNSKLIAYPYPIPLRAALGFDEKYMKEAKDKIIKFYEKHDFIYLSDINVATFN